MNHFLIDRNATVSGKSVVSEEKSFAPQIHDTVADGIVDILGASSRLNHGSNTLKCSGDHLPRRSH